MELPFFGQKKIEIQEEIKSSKMDESPSETGGKVVEVKDLRVIYNPGKTNEARALNGINIEIFPEEYVMFFGPSGCGKSTLLNIIAGLENPSEGTVIVAGQNLANLTPKKMAEFHRDKIGMIFQAYNLIPTLNVLDNIILPQIFERVRSRKRKEWGKTLLQKFGLEKFGKRLPQEMSGGQQQRVGIARALVNDPAIILADEAVGNLDSESAQNVLEILSKLNTDDKKTIIAVTHNPEHLYYADRIFYMKDGAVIKTEINKDKKQAVAKKELPKEVAEKKERTDLDLLLQAYPDLSGMQLHTMLAPFKAKVLANYLISRFEEQEIKFLESLITSRLMDRIDRKMLLDSLTRPVAENGLGLGAKTALHYSGVIEEVVAKAEFIRQELPLIKKGEPDPTLETVDELRKSLLDGYHGNFSLDQVEALNKGIEYRLLGKINIHELREYFDRPFHEGGVGMNRKTAKQFAKKLELILLTEYGKDDSH